jgi:hypothetical protein
VHELRRWRSSLRGLLGALLLALPLAAEELPREIRPTYRKAISGDRDAQIQLVGWEMHNRQDYGFVDRWIDSVFAAADRGHAEAQELAAPPGR